MPSRGRPRGRGRPPVLTPAEAVVVAVAQVLLRCDDERRWMRMAAGRIGHLFPRLPSQSQYNRQLRALGPAMSAAALWLARQVPTWHEPLRLMDGTPIRCGASRVTVNRSHLGEIAGYGMDKSHHAFASYEVSPPHADPHPWSSRAVSLNLTSAPGQDWRSRLCPPDVRGHDVAGLEGRDVPRGWRQKGRRITRPTTTPFVWLQARTGRGRIPARCSGRPNGRIHRARRAWDRPAPAGSVRSL